MAAAVGIVTGASKGIGYAIVRRLALEYPASALCGASRGAPLLIYLTARSRSRGEAALERIRVDAELRDAGVLERQRGAEGGRAGVEGVGGSGTVDVKFRQLDVDGAESVASFGEFVGGEHPRGVDFVVNNAGVSMEGFDSNVVATTLRTNYYGLVRTTRTLLPHLKPAPTSRVVNMGSFAGMLGQYSAEVASRFRAARAEDEVTALMREFADAVAAREEGRMGRDGEVEHGRTGEHGKSGKSGKIGKSGVGGHGNVAGGFPPRAYGVSKAGVIAFSRALAAELAAASGAAGPLVNACCPGFVRTDITRGRGKRTADEGARTPVLLALGDIGGRSGGYWTGGKEEEW